MTHRILITGAGGQVGQEVVELCKAQGLAYLGCSSRQLDITNAQSVAAVFSEFKPTAVINCAAYTAVDNAEDEPEQAYAVNEQGPKLLAEACAKASALMLHISTDYVFDGDKASDYEVGDQPNPVGVYGASKLAGEIAIQDSGADHMILRVSWVFGQYGNNFVKTMLRLAKDRNELSVVDDQYGAPTAALDIARILLERVLTGGPSGVQHLESNPGVTWCEFARYIFDVVGVELTVKAIGSEEYLTRVKRPMHSKLSSDFFEVNWEGVLLEMLSQRRVVDKT